MCEYLRNVAAIQLTLILSSMAALLNTSYAFQGVSFIITIVRNLEGHFGKISVFEDVPKNIAVSVGVDGSNKFRDILQILC